MARRVLTLGVLLGALVAGACQVGPIAIVECRSSTDCTDGTYCSPDHECVVLDAPGAIGGPMETPPAPPNHAGNLITWDASGNVPNGQNDYGIAGPWFLYDDCGSVVAASTSGTIVCPANAPTPNCCTARDPALVGPPPDGDPGWSVTPGVAGETSGRACARVVTGALIDGVQWGAGLALNLNNWGSFDATRVFDGGRIIGFSFDIDAPLAGAHDLQVGLGTTDNDSHYLDLPIPSQGVKLFFDHLPYSYSSPPKALDLTAVNRINFAMPAVESAMPYDFCVTNLRVLLEGDATAPDSETQGQDVPDGGVPVPGTDAATAVTWNDGGRIVATEPFAFTGTWGIVDDTEDVALAIASGKLVCPAVPATPGCCTVYDPSLVGPAPGHAPGRAVTGGTAEDGRSRFCVKGTTTQIINDTSGMLAYGTQFGMILSMPLANGQPYDMTRTFPGGRVVGFGMDIDGPPMSVPLLVGLGTSAGTYSVDVAVPARGAQVLFADVKLATWVMPQVPLDLAQLKELTFLVGADPSGATPFDFCVSNVHVLQETPPPGG